MEIGSGMVTRNKNDALNAMPGKGMMHMCCDCNVHEARILCEHVQRTTTSLHGAFCNVHAFA